MIGRLPIAIREMASDDVLRSLESLLGAVDYGVLFTDLNHISLLCNAKFGEIFTIDPDLVVQNNVEAVRDMVRSRIVDFESWRKNLDDIYLNQELEQEDELKLQNPSLVIRRFTGPVRDDSGQVVGRLWTFLDVTRAAQRRRMQDALREAALYFDPDPKNVCQFVADTIGAHFDSISVVSILESDFMRFHTVGGPPSPAHGLPGNRLDQSYCQFCLQSAAPFVVQDAKLDPQLQNLLPAQAGYTRYLGVPVHDPLGVPIGTLCVLDDRSNEPFDDDDLNFMITLALKVSGEIERQSQLMALETSLAETSEELKQTQEQLVQSEKLAVTGTLSAAIAHDIRNILASILLQIDMSAENPDEALAYVRESLGRFNVLAHRLLSYAKPQQAMMERIDLNDVVERVAALLAPQFTMSKVKLEVTPSPEPARIQGDAGRLEHLIVNLIVNALNAASADGVVAVSVQQSAEGVTLEVRDNGPGVPPEMLPKLFLPFVSSRRNGFGLGLYSCGQIVKEHNGQLQCESIEGVGATFRVTLQPCP